MSDASSAQFSAVRRRSWGGAVIIRGVVPSPGDDAEPYLARMADPHRRRWAYRLCWRRVRLRAKSPHVVTFDHLENIPEHVDTITILMGDGAVYWIRSQQRRDSSQ